jgi:hypothetical protein
MQKIPIIGLLWQFAGQCPQVKNLCPRIFTDSEGIFVQKSVYFVDLFCVLFVKLVDGGLQGTKIHPREFLYEATGSWRFDLNSYE